MYMYFLSALQMQSGSHKSCHLSYVSAFSFPLHFLHLTAITAIIIATNKATTFRLQAINST